MHLQCGLGPPSPGAHTPGRARAVSAQGSGLQHFLWRHEVLQVGRLRFYPESLKGCPPAPSPQLRGQWPHLGEDAVRPSSAGAFQEHWNLLPDAPTPATSPIRTGPALEDWEAVAECARVRGHGQEKGQRGRCGASRPLLGPREIAVHGPAGTPACLGRDGKQKEGRGAGALSRGQPPSRIPSGKSLFPTVMCPSRRSRWGWLCWGRLTTSLPKAPGE